MKDIQTDFFKAIMEARQEVIKAGGRPDTLKISKQAIEKVKLKLKLFGMDIEIVEADWLPDGVEFMVYQEGAVHPNGRAK